MSDGRVTAKPLAQHCALENGSDLRVLNKRPKIRHYRDIMWVNWAIKQG